MSDPAPTSRLRYVVLRHDGIDHPHFDVMIETAPGSHLATWRSPVWPIESPTELRRLRDHRPAYLTFQGAIAGGLGHVYQVASGTGSIETDYAGITALTLGEPPRAHRIRLEDRHDDHCVAVPIATV